MSNTTRCCGTCYWLDQAHIDGECVISCGYAPSGNLPFWATHFAVYPKSDRDGRAVFTTEGADCPAWIIASEMEPENPNS